MSLAFGVLLLAACNADQGEQAAEITEPAAATAVIPVEEAPALAPTAENYTMVLQEASAARKAASAAGAEWLAVEGLLEQAAVEAGQENWERAIELAAKAKLLCELGLRQAEDEATRWEQRVIR